MCSETATGPLYKMGCSSMKPMTDHTRALSAEMRLVVTFCTTPKVPQESNTRRENHSQGACMGL